jgi:pyridoxal phosphate enzyme (YggS family)
MEEELRIRLEGIRRELTEASKAWGRAPRIIAVSKTVAPEAINPLKDMELFDLGENRVQEMLEKMPFLYPKFRMHLIGRLQTNKVKYIMGKVCLIHSLDRMELAGEIDRQARKSGCVMDVLVQVNIAGEAQKGGIAPGEAEGFLRECSLLPGLRVLGLMSVMPLADDPESLRPLFRGMRTLFEDLAKEQIPGVRMEELSMGMSQDFRIAAQEGATMVRIGSALFGARSPKATN